MRCKVILVLILGCSCNKAAGPSATGKAEDPLEQARNTEVPAVLGELAIMEEQYQAENGVFLSLGAEDAWWPSKPLSHATAADEPKEWKVLHVRLEGMTPLSCQYLVVAGPPDSLEAAGPLGKRLLAGKAPPRNWYYALARCGDHVVGRRWDGSEIQTLSGS